MRPRLTLWKVGPPQTAFPSATPSREVEPIISCLSLNMFCQCIYMWMYVIPAADLYLWKV